MDKLSTTHCRDYENSRKTHFQERMKQLAVILHNRVSAHPTPDEADVLNQVKLVENALTNLGYTCRVMDVGYDLTPTFIK
jgi:hypothetical protein